MNLTSLLHLLYNFFVVERHIQSLTVINCLNASTNVNFLKKIATESISVHLMSLNNFNITNSAKFLQTNSVSMGVFLDYNCASSDKFIETVSMLLFFHPGPSKIVLLIQFAFSAKNASQPDLSG